MFGYYLSLAWRSLCRRGGLTVLMIVAIGFGIAASMTTYAVFRAVSADPIPWKSRKLFVPLIDAFGPRQSSKGGGGEREPPGALTYTDAMALMRAHRGTQQSAIYTIDPTIEVAGAARRAVSVQGQAVYGEFFPMLDVPFRYGAPWSARDDARRARVVVLSSHLNTKLFGGSNSVGKTVIVDGKAFRIVGVMDGWDPEPRFYNVRDTGGFDKTPEDVFVPLPTAIEVGIGNKDGVSCITAPAAGFVGLQRSGCVWLAFMVELDDAAAVATYRDFLNEYAREQQRVGRFTWPPNNRLRDLPAWLDYMHVVPRDSGVSLIVAVSLLAVCLVNTAGLLLAKFLRRSDEIGVRRALGARRRAIYAQFLTEAGLVGVAGTVLGLLLTGVGVTSIDVVLPADIAVAVHLDLPLLGITLIVGVAATLLAGFYPAFRASCVQPALQLKAN